jgi:hypothetical protein
MMKFATVLGSLILSYSVVSCVLGGDEGKALATAVLAASIFSLSLFAVGLTMRNRGWLAFGVANAALTGVFVALELWGLSGSHPTRFGGLPLAVNGHISGAGSASVAADVGICLSANFLGFYLWRLSRVEWICRNGF